MNDCLKTLNIKDFLFLRSILASVSFSTRTVNKTNASQNVERRHKSNITVHPNLDVGHGISRGLPNGLDELTGYDVTAVVRLLECIDSRSFYMPTTELCKNAQ